MEINLDDAALDLINNFGIGDQRKNIDRVLLDADKIIQMVFNFLECFRITNTTMATIFGFFTNDLSDLQSKVNKFTDAITNIIDELNAALPDLSNM